MHDPDTDLHTFEDVGAALIHPHTHEGYQFLVRRLGADVMDEYEYEEDEPEVSLEDLPGLIEAALGQGLSVERTLSSRVAHQGFDPDRRN